MESTDKERERLLGEHEGIRAHMKFIAKNLGNLAGQKIQIRERIWIYRWGLWDFRDAVQRHIELDERIFREFKDNALVEETMNEHDEIKKMVDDAIALANNAVEKELGREDLTQSAVNIRKIFDRIRKLIEEHTAREDIILEPARKSHVAK